MITKLSQVQLIDGTHRNSGPNSLYLVDGKIAYNVPAGSKIDADYSLAGHVVMAGGIDIHTHIGGGKVNLARLLLPNRNPTFQDPRAISRGLRR
jgi:formylmethanofuran dehydrogenase subunit A